MMRAAMTVLHDEIPVLGINAGNLAYLMGLEFKPEETEAWYTPWYKGWVPAKEEKVEEVSNYSSESTSNGTLADSDQLAALREQLLNEKK